MSLIPIPNLPAAISLTGAEMLEAVQAGTSVRITVSQIALQLAEPQSITSPNVATLIGTGTPVAGTPLVAFTQGYYTPGDGAGLSYEWDSASTLYPNGFWLAPTVLQTAIVGEVIATGNGSQTSFSGTFAHPGIYRLSITITATGVTIHDDGTGVLTSGAPTMTDSDNVSPAGFGFIDYTTGIWNFQFAAAPSGAITSNYQYAKPGRYIPRIIGNLDPIMCGAKGDYVRYPPLDPNVVNGTDDTLAIIACLGIVPMNGQINYTRLHRIQPQSSGTHALVIRRGYITSVSNPGCGVCYLGWGGVDPSTHWQVLSGPGGPFVWRGGGIQILTGATSGATVDNVRFSNMLVYGNTTGNGDASSPANVGTGGGWDTTNKGVFWQLGDGTRYWNGAYVDDCQIIGFRGELMQAASTNGGIVKTRKCVFGNTNADGENNAGSTYYSEDNEYFNCSASHESAVLPGSTNVIRGHNIHDMPLSGITVIRQQAGATNGPASVTIEDINLKNVAHQGIVGAVENLTIQNIGMVDVGDATTYPGIQIDATVGLAHNISNTFVDNIRFSADTRSLLAPLKVVQGSNSILGTTIENVTSTLTDNAVAGSFVIKQTYNNSDLAAHAPLPAGVYIRKNGGNSNSGNPDTADSGSRLFMVAQNVESTTTSFLVVAKYYPQFGGMYRVSGQLRVTGATTVTLAVAWPDAAGANHVENVYNAASLAAGVWPFDLTFYSAPAAGAPIQVVPTCSVANQVFTSCEIEDL